MSQKSDPRRWSRWTDAEKAYLRENYARMPVKDLAEALGRTVETTRVQARKFGLVSPRGPRGALWSEEEREFLRQNYHAGMPVAEIAKQLGRTFGTTVGQAGKLGLRKPLGDIWTEEEKECLRQHYATTPVGELARRLGRSQEAVRRHGHRLGLTPDAEKLRAARRAAIRHDYFSVIDAPLKAYILGWLATDGYITNTIGIRLSQKDAEVVELIRGELAPLHAIRRIEGNTRQYQGRTITGGPSVEFRLISACMKKDLAKLSVTPRKSHILQYPDIPVHLDNNFILGCFEGDGSLYRRRDGRYQWSLYSASVPFLTAVQSHVEHAIGIKLFGPYRQGSSSVSKLSCQHQEHIRALDAWLHADIPGLARKSLASRLEN